MKVLITGHEGFIGQNLWKHLSNSKYELEGYEYDPLVFPDVSKYDIVIHLGANSSTTETDVEKVMQMNFDFSVQLLSECFLNSVKFIYASSASVYGTTNDFREESSLSPQSPYAWSKYLFDRGVVNALSSNYGSPVIGLRFFNVYGNHEEHKGDQMSVIHKFKAQSLADGAVHPFEESEFYHRDFICAEDVCAIIEKMIYVNASGIFNVGTGETESFENVANYIAEKYDAKIVPIPMPDNLSTQYQSYTKSNNTKLTSIIGKYKFTTIKEWIEKWKD